MGGSTNLSLGWYLGLLELQTYMTENHNNRLFLLSDGQANQGETKVTILAQEASKSRELGITTSTIGIGDDFQEDILAAIATESGGRFWYIQESQIKDIINEEFKGAMSVIIDRPRIELKLPAGVTVSKELNNLKKMADKYRTRPIKGEDQFNFAIRLEINSEKIETDNLNFEAILFDGEESIIQTQMVVAIKCSQEYVYSKINPIVQSVVQQFKITVTNEKIMRQMPQGGLDVIRKMLIEDVEGMRKVKDALLEKEREVSSPRDMQEIGDVSRHLDSLRNALLLIEMLLLREFEEVQEIYDFQKRWQRVNMQIVQRMEMRNNNEFNIVNIN